jgi:hypothetical protein
MLPPDSQGNNRGWHAEDLRPDGIPTEILHRFIASFQPGPDEECWLWQGGRHRRGYGLIYTSRGPYLAHRLSWVLFNDLPLTDDLTVDHLCYNQPCVNPAHLEAVSLAENLRRAREHYGHMERPGPPEGKWTCTECGTVTRNDGMRRHWRRKHGLPRFQWAA